MPEYRKSAERIAQLTEQQYRVTQQDETEPSFANLLSLLAFLPC
jgi:peptide methionine sulfoxide reductase MsrB